MTASSILPAWQSGDTGALPALLAEQATFSSPVADYRGRADAAHMLTLIAGVIENLQPTRSWQADGETVSAFIGRAVGRDLEGMLREQRDETGRLVQVTLFLRPYRALGVAIERMAELMAESPLPSRPS
jgi:hypothetical protein